MFIYKIDFFLFILKEGCKYFLYINIIIMSNIKSKQDILAEFLHKYKDLPKQGSSEWLNQRKFTVGGSQIATIMGVNKYENLRSFVKTKMPFYKFKKEAPLWFGNLMEPCVEQFVEIEYNTKTYETGSLPCDFNKYLSYSPDGLCIISKDKLKKMLDKHKINIKELPEGKDSIVLLEFKSPFMRKIKYGEVPDYYVPQPLLGMEIIKISEISIFIECVFRFCSYSDLFNNKYSYYHYDKERYTNEAIMYSAISIFYEEESNENIKEILANIEEFKGSRFGGKFKDGDLSSISERQIINKIMELTTDKDSNFLQPVYHNMYSNREQDYECKDSYTFNIYNNSLKFNNELSDIKNANRHKKYLGTLCYKLLDINQVPIKKTEILTEELNNKISKTFEYVKDIIKTIEDKKIDSADSFEKEWKIISKTIPTKL